MNITFNSLRCKEVVNVRDGCRLGYVEDVVINTENGCVISFSVPSRGHFLGLLSRGEAINIPWQAVERIGDDIILVSCDIIQTHNKKTGFFEMISKWLKQ